MRHETCPLKLITRFFYVFNRILGEVRVLAYIPDLKIMILASITGIISVNVEQIIFFFQVLIDLQSAIRARLDI